MVRLLEAVSYGASWLWAFSCSLQRFLLQGMPPQDQVWWMVWQAWLLGWVELRMWPLRAEHCWLLPKVSPRQVGCEAPRYIITVIPTPWEQCCCEPDLSLHKPTPSSVHCCSLSPCVLCQEPKGLCAGPNPHPPRQLLGGFLKNQGLP